MRRRLGGLVILLLVGGCGSSHGESLLGDGSEPSPTVSRAASPQATTAPQVLEALAEAVRSRHRTAFAALLGGSSAFRQQQLRLYDNLQALPVADLSFGVSEGVVRRSLRLEGYDDGTLVGPAGFRVGRERGRLVALPDPAHPAREPWDLTRLTVAHSAHVLVLTDDSFADQASELRAATDAAITKDDAVVPVTWSGKAVVLAFRDPDVLATYAQVPGGALEHLGALTYPVRSNDDVVGMRLALLAPALSAGRDELDRVLRHELVHVALGADVSDVPTWLTEGVAEYVSMLPIPTDDRRIATVAVDRAQAGTITLPAAASFNGDDQTLHYAVAWMACDYLADTRGEEVLWELIDAMQTAHVGRDGAGQDAVLHQVTGLDSAGLARATSARILRLFG